MRNETLDLFGKISGMSDADAVGWELLSYARRLGMDGGNIWFGGGQAGWYAKNSPATTYCAETLRYMYEETESYKLEMSQYVETSLAPGFWGFDIARHRYEKDSFDYQYAVKNRDLNGMQCSMIIPIRTIGRAGSSGVSFYTSEKSERFQKILNEKMSDFVIAAYASHSLMQSLGAAHKPSATLSTREKECLLFFARGMRTKEIADRLNIREVTVTLHVTNARRKLSARTRDQAVAIAIIDGHICP